MSSSRETLSIDEESSPNPKSSFSNRTIRHDRLEDDLFATIEQLINRFMRQDNRRHPYWTRIRWVFDNETDLAYRISLSIEEESRSL